jgi:outer membrane autotransporter protein
MLSSLFMILIQAPFPFEVKRGFSVEPFGSVSTLDQTDDSAESVGTRFSYIFSDKTDAFFTIELSSQWQHVSSATSTVRSRMSFDMMAIAYEIYNPWAMRVGGGGGFERRSSQWNTSIGYRVGMGRYFNQRVAVFGDFSQRFIFRDDLASPLELSLSIQFIL